MGHIQDLELHPNINGRSVHTSRGTFLKCGPACHSAKARLVITPSEQVPNSLTPSWSGTNLKFQLFLPLLSCVSLTLGKYTLQTLPHKVSFLTTGSHPFFCLKCLPFSSYPSATSKDLHIFCDLILRPPLTWSLSKSSQTYRISQGSELAYNSVSLLLYLANSPSCCSYLDIVFLSCTWFMSSVSIWKTHQ